jgi:hypothetical protein
LPQRLRAFGFKLLKFAVRQHHAQETGSPSSSSWLRLWFHPNQLEKHAKKGRCAATCQGVLKMKYRWNWKT